MIAVGQQISSQLIFHNIFTNAKTILDFFALKLATMVNPEQRLKRCATNFMQRIPCSAVRYPVALRVFGLCNAIAESLHDDNFAVRDQSSSGRIARCSLNSFLAGKATRKFSKSVSSEHATGWICCVCRRISLGVSGRYSSPLDVPAAIHDSFSTTSVRHTSNDTVPVQRMTY